MLGNCLFVPAPTSNSQLHFHDAYVPGSDTPPSPWWSYVGRHQGCCPLLGRWTQLWDGLEALEDRFQIEAVTSPSGVTHVTLRPAAARCLSKDRR
jgi:hypothetical protein